MATGNIAMALGAILDLDDSGFNDKMEAKPAQAERLLSEVANIAHDNLSRIGDEAEKAQDALGQSMSDAAEDAAEAFEDMRESAEESFSDIASLAERYLSFGALKDFASGVIAEFMEGDIAAQRLKASLASLGVASNATFEQISNLSSEIEELTRYAADEVVAALGQGLRLGLDPKIMDDAAKAAAGLAEKLSLDLGTAMALVARASNGNTSVLAKYGLKLDETKSKAEQFQDVLQIGKESFGLAEDAANTAQGRLDKMNVAIGNMRQAIGEMLAEYLLPVIDVVKSAAVAFNGLSDTSKRLIVGLGAAAAGMAALRLSGGGVLATVIKLIPTLAGLTASTAASGAAATGAATGFAAFWAAAAGPISLALASIVALKAAFDKIDSHYDEAIAKAKDAQGQAQQLRAKLQGENEERVKAIKRLEEMSRLGKLNKATQKEANALIEKYGLNMKVVNGQLDTMGTNFDDLIKKQEEMNRKHLAFSYDKEIAALESEMDAMERKATGVIASTKQGFLAVAGVYYEMYQRLFGDKSYRLLDRKTKLISDDKFVSRQLLQYRKLNEKLQELKRNKEDALKNDNVGKSAEKLGEDAAKAMRPALDALMEQREEFRMAKMDAAELTKALEGQAETLRKNIGRQHYELEDYTDEQLAKLKEIEEIENRIVKIHDDSVQYIKQANDELLKYQREQRRIASGRQFEKNFDKALENAKTQNDYKTITGLTSRRVQLAKAAAKSALDQYNAALKEAKKDELITDMEKKQLEQRLQNLKDADALAEREQERHERAVETIQRKAAKRQEEQEERNMRHAEALQRQAERQAAQISRRLGMLGMGNLDRNGFAFDSNGRFRGNVGAGALARFNRTRDSMAETRAKIEALNAGQRTYIDAAGKERRVHFSLQDKRNMREIEKLEGRRHRLEERAKDYTGPIEDVKSAVEELGKNCVIVKR